MSNITHHYNPSLFCHPDRCDQTHCLDPSIFPQMGMNLEGCMVISNDSPQLGVPLGSFVQCQKGSKLKENHTKQSNSVQNQSNKHNGLN